MEHSLHLQNTRKKHFFLADGAVQVQICDSVRPKRYVLYEETEVVGRNIRSSNFPFWKGQHLVAWATF